MAPKIQLLNKKYPIQYAEPKQRIFDDQYEYYDIDAPLEVGKVVDFTKEIKGNIKPTPTWVKDSGSSPVHPFQSFEEGVQTLSVATRDMGVNPFYNFNSSHASQTVETPPIQLYSKGVQTDLKTIRVEKPQQIISITAQGNVVRRIEKKDSKQDWIGYR